IIFAFSAFVVDAGYVQVSKTRLQSATDSAALAGIMDLDSNNVNQIRGTIDSYLLANGFNPRNSGNRRTIDYGIWDDENGTYRVTTIANSNALRVKAETSTIPSFFGKMLGHNQYKTSAESIVVLGGGPPRDVVIVLDRSGSMSSNMSNRRSRMENTITAAQTLVDNLGENDRVALASYSYTDGSRKYFKSTGEVQTGLSFSRSITKRAASRMKASGNTNIGGGIRAGLDVFLSDPAPRDATEPELVKIMVVMTDGNANQPEPYPYPNDGPTGVLPAGNWKKLRFDAYESMQRWSNTVRARGIKIYSVKLGGSYNEPFRYTASAPDEYSKQYYFHIPTGREDVSKLLETYKHIGIGNGGPKIVR
ncbi:MAG: VWA domain-containing protein, partial [Planctomycetaceae bacterium]|nr:VWA domain-containing protein [Planctomycetaceae bacterium]